MLLLRSGAAAALLLGLASCAKSTPPDPVPAPSASSSTSTGGNDGTDADATLVADAGRRALATAEPAVQLSARLADASAPDPACTAPDLDLAVAVVDPRCAIAASEAKLLRTAIEKHAPAPLRQEASMADDGRVVVRVVNTGDKPLALPLSFHPDVPAFSAIAESPDRAIYELEPPRLEVAGPAAEPDAGAKARFARIVLAPGKGAVARVRVGPAVVRRIAPACPDGGACAPPCRDAGPCAPRLAPGAYVLHVGELVVDVEAGAPARVAWTVR